MRDDRLPLRSLTVDTDHIARYAGAIDGPVVMVGHSYGGAVIGAASTQLPNVVGLVYVAAFILAEGESCLDVAGKFPPTKLVSALRPTRYLSGGRNPRWT
jgi:pimeloyl-ACP methyl ester carboxylesterase